MKALILVFLLFGLARSALRLGVFESSDCSESSLVGMIYTENPPLGVYPEACTETYDGQYYNIVPDLPNQPQSERPSDWNYWFSGTTEVAPSCAEFTENNAVIYGSKPFTCLNYKDWESGAESSIFIYNCADGAARIVRTYGYNCYPASIDEPYSIECTIWGGWIDKIVCAVPSVPTSEPVSSEPTATPTATPSSSPSATPSAPAGANSPVKKSLASTAQLSVVGAVAVLVLFVLN